VRLGTDLRRLIAWLITAPALFSVALHAQVVGATLYGTIKDSSGTGLPRAVITVRNIETGAERKLLTDDVGRYSVPSIPIGPYELQAEKPGFASQIKRGINVVVGQSAAVDLILQVGELKQVMVVEESPSPVALSTQGTSGLVSERQVKDLPLNGRSFDELMTLNAAVVNYTAERSGGIGTSNSSVGNMFAVSGRRPQENLFLLNGIEYTGASLINNTPGGTSGQLMGVDAVREFNVVSDTYGAEYGKRPGGQVSIVTASGTNGLHGSVYDFFRNSALDARNFFDQGSAPEFQRDQFGVAAGGPIRKNKAFLFANYEGFRQTLALSDVTLVPDNASRALAVPAVTPLLALWPVPNGPELGGGIAEAFSHPLQHIREDFGTTRFDYDVSSKDTIFAVYTVDDSSAGTPSANPLSSVVETLREQVASVEEQHVVSSALLNTARAGFSRAGYFFTGETPVSLPGWVAGDPIGALVVGGGTALNGASQISLAGTNAGSNLRAVRNLFTYSDHVAFTHAIHQLEAGVWVQQIQANDNLAQDQYGQASFSSLAAFLSGTVSTFTVVPSPTPLSWRTVEGAGYAQDVLQLRSNLQLRVGFRFESTNGWNEAHGRAANYRFDSSGVIETDPAVGSSVFSVNRAKFFPDPRAALAWDPFHKGRTVVRAGFGLYRALLDNLDYRLDQTAPFNTTETYKNVSISNLSGAAGSKISPSGIQPDAYTPAVITWTFKVEQQVASNMSVSAGYVGSHGYHEMLSVDANQPFPSFAGGPAFYPANAPLANPNLANTTTWFSEGLSSYNALELDVNRRFRHGLQLRGVYTFSKSLDDGSAWNSSVGVNAPGFVMFPLYPRLDWGPSTSDVRHLLSVNGSYERKGWTLSAIAGVQSGFPFTPQLGYNPTGNGDSRNPVRPSWNPAFTGSVIEGGAAQYFNPAAFLPPATGTYGNVGRDVLTGPGLANLDISLMKNIPISERVRVQARVECFNIFNHTNLATPNAVVFTSGADTPSPTAGVVNATSTTSRQIQFGMKLLW